MLNLTYMFNACQYKNGTFRIIVKGMKSYEVILYLILLCFGRTSCLLLRTTRLYVMQFIWDHVHIYKLVYIYIKHMYLKVFPARVSLTHWGRVTHICIVSDNGLSPLRCQAIIWNYAAILSIRPQKAIWVKFYSKFLFFIQRKLF